MPMNEIAAPADAKITQYAEEAVNKKLSTLLSCPFLAKVKSAHDVNVYVPSHYKPMVIGR
jgi:predicted PilT family ATPase